MSSKGTQQTNVQVPLRNYKAVVNNLLNRTKLPFYTNNPYLAADISNVTVHLEYIKSHLETPSTIITSRLFNSNLAKTFENTMAQCMELMRQLEHAICPSRDEWNGVSKDTRVAMAAIANKFLLHSTEICLVKQISRIPVDSRLDLK
jgi:hypothetical protein